MLALRLDQTLEKQLTALAVAKGASKSALIREAILRMLEDEEDFALAEGATQALQSTKPLAELRKELGLES